MHEFGAIYGILPRSGLESPVLLANPERIPSGVLVMLGIILDMIVLGLLLNFVSDDDWGDQKLKLFLIALGIALLGGAAVHVVLPYVGVASLGIYFVVAGLVLWGFTDNGLKPSMIIAAIFVAYKIVFALALIFLFAPRA